MEMLLTRSAFWIQEEQYCTQVKITDFGKKNISLFKDNAQPKVDIHTAMQLNINI